MAKVAIVTRTKDRVLFLRRAIMSVHSQTYKDFIHIIVNDGGRVDEIEAAIEEFPETVRNKISLYHRPKSSGAPDTIFNESIDRVDSEYVAIHDDDDTWRGDFLEQTVPILDSGAQGVLARVDNQYEKIKNGKIKKGKTTRHMPNMRSVSLYDQCLDNQLTPVAFVYRRSAYEEVGKYDERLPVAGDWEFGIRFLLRYDVEYVDPGYALAYYHRRHKADNSYTLHSHRKYLTKILNQYLREDISNGSLGIGYVMNKQWAERDRLHGVLKKMTPKVIVDAMRGKK